MPQSTRKPRADKTAVLPPPAAIQTPTAEGTQADTPPGVTPHTPSRPRKQKRPAKPYDDFPLFPHATRRWAKKIRGKLHYFGPWDDWQAALKKYQEQSDDLHAGRTPRAQAEGFAVRDLLNHFRTSKKRLADAGEITPRTHAEYIATCDRIVAAFGATRLVLDLVAEDFGNPGASWPSDGGRWR
jgi:hypothetical protein